MGVILGLIIFAGALWLLFQVGKRDLAQCLAVLDMAPPPHSTTEQGTTPEGFPFAERVVAQGALFGRPATLARRVLRSPFARKRYRGSIFTVLSLTLERPARATFRLQPAGILSDVETLVRGAVADRVPIDPAFDQAYVVYSNAPDEARAVLTPSVREQILAFRTHAAGHLADALASGTTAAKMSSGLVLGTFHVEGSAARYVAFGSPAKATAEHVKAAAPVLLTVANALTGDQRGSDR